jgi:hypothetical protein
VGGAAAVIVGTRPTIAVLLVAAVGVLAAVLTWRAEHRPDAPGRAQELLVAPQDLPLEVVGRVTLRRGPEMLAFERSGDAWSQVEPFAHPMDPYSIRQLAVQAMSARVAAHHGPGEAAAADLGLDPPRAQLTWAWPGGALTLHVGRRGAGGRWYVRRGAAGEILSATGELYERAVETNPAEWRDRTIFPGAGIEADELIIVQGPQRTVLRRDRRTWKMVEPAGTRLDRRAQSALFQAIAGGRCGGFILDRPPDLGSFGLASPVGSVTVRMTRLEERDGQMERVPVEQSLLVGAPMASGSQDRFGMVARRPVVVRLPQSLLAALFPPPERLIDGTGTHVRPPDVEAAIVRGPEGELTLRRRGELWVVGERGAEVTGPLVEEFLRRLTVERAVEIELRGYPREHELATVTLVGPGDRPLDTVRVVRHPDTGRICLENGDDVLRIMPPGTEIPLTPAAFGLPAVLQGSGPG